METIANFILNSILLVLMVLFGALAGVFALNKLILQIIELTAIFRSIFKKENT